MHACLAEQALNAGDLVTAADQVLAGLAVLNGAALAGEEIRLLAAGARVGADLASLPRAARPAGIAASWEACSGQPRRPGRALVAEHGGRQPEVAAFGSLVEAEIARQHGRDDPGGLAGRRGRLAAAGAAVPGGLRAPA